MRHNYFIFALAITLAGTFLACAVLGGPGSAFDAGMVERLTAARVAEPALAFAANWVTQAGGAVATLGLTIVAAAWLGWNRQAQRGLALIAIVLSGRFMIDALKWLVDRPRPSFEPYPVTSSLSFPSGHTGNSMIAFLAAALILAPRRSRPAAMAAAVAASLAVGITRPLLGVHWPSDVVGGWAFGALWVIAWAALLARIGGTAGGDLAEPRPG